MSLFDLKRILRSILNRTGAFGSLFFELLVRVKFRHEFLALQGNLKAKNSLRTAVHIGMNKSASQYFGRVLKCYAKQAQFNFLSYNGLAFNSILPPIEKIIFSESESRMIFSPLGQIHSFFGSPPPAIIDRADLNVILVVRDPRDILVSQYFSRRKSHVEPPVTSSAHLGFMARRKMSRDQDFSEHVVHLFNEIKDEPLRILKFVDTFPGNLKIFKYEDLLRQHVDLYNELDDLFECTLSRKQKSVLGTIAAAEPKKEFSHRRSGLQGQYATMIPDQALNELNSYWSDFLSRFNYPKC